MFVFLLLYPGEYEVFGSDSEVYRFTQSENEPTSNAVPWRLQKNVRLEMIGKELNLSKKRGLDASLECHPVTA